MKKIIVASKNPVKISSALIAFEKMFPDEKFEVEAVSVSSGVDRQPKTEFETLQGAFGRASNACKEKPDADFWVGVEGGVEEKNYEMQAFAWAAVKSKDGKFGKGRTGTFFLPAPVAELIRQGKELGEAGDIVFQKVNSKQANGSIGLLTGNATDRKECYVQAIMFALIPFKNRNLYF